LQEDFFKNNFYSFTDEHEEPELPALTAINTPAVLKLSEAAFNEFGSHCSLLGQPYEFPTAAGL
jgi:hypothetical protein